MSLLKNWSSDAPVKSVFSDFFEREPFSNFFNRNWLSEMPAANIKENIDSFAIEMAAPGLRKDDFKITLHDNHLTINVDKHEEKLEEDENYTRREYNYNSFSRSFFLPESVNGETINAKYDNGVLKLTLPKKEETVNKGHKSITVS